MYTLNSSLKQEDEDDDEQDNKISCNKFWQVLMNNKISQ